MNHKQPLLAATTTSASPPKPISISISLSLSDITKLLDEMEALMRDPLADWMRAEGFDPDRGALLVLPPAMRDELGPFPPPYVRFSKFVEAPCMVDGFGLNFRRIV